MHSISLFKLENITFRLRYFPDFVSPIRCDEIFAELLNEVPWIQRHDIHNGAKAMQPRLTAWYGDVAYRYAGVTVEANTEVRLPYFLFVFLCWDLNIFIFIYIILYWHLPPGEIIVSYQRYQLTILLVIPIAAPVKNNVNGECGSKFKHLTDHWIKPCSRDEWVNGRSPLFMRSGVVIEMTEHFLLWRYIPILEWQSLPQRFQAKIEL